MRKLTPEGEQAVKDIAQRYGVSFDAIATMLNAVANGGGTMAQFNHPEFGGGGQWMQGGMTMVGDMFNHGLKSQVDSVCYELSNLLASSSVFAPIPVRKEPAMQQGAPTQFSSQSQSSGANVSVYMSQNGMGGQWWPEDLGQPSATGSQNDMQYAYFPNIRRLALNAFGGVGVYDTLDHNISGFGQQQSGDASITFSSQYGVVSLNSLPRVDNVQPDVTTEPSASAPKVEEAEPNFAVEEGMADPLGDNQGVGSVSESQEDVFALLERLAQLRDAKIINDKDFEAKKQELLDRI